ncbi:MAG: glycosidase [Parcubacteria group bacterium]|nr:glycosidase [Candidatus Liptonbacteria bacterium]MBI3019872.1 glycosidase [Parcubacteria group bacterium]MBI3075349.1 glycosidase [Parcubacteria group bacterium]
MGKKIIQTLKWLFSPYEPRQSEEKLVRHRAIVKKRIPQKDSRKAVQAKKKKPATPRVFFAKAEENPIIYPQKENDWEAWQTFNPGAVLIDGKVHFLYRAIGADGTSRFGYAASADGFTLDERLPHPVYEHPTAERTFSVFSYLSGGSWGGAEDPRVVHIEEDKTIYITYTACDGGLRVALTSLSVDDFVNKKWNWREPLLLSPPDEVHKNWVLFPEKINGRYAILHSIRPQVQIEYVDSLDTNDAGSIKSYHGGPPQKGSRWDKWLRGAGAPPLKTKDGWLVFYHAMDNDWSQYKVGAMLLDLNDPTKVLYRAAEPVLKPSEHYEQNGHKPGVIYATGAVIMNDDILVYYGCADNYIGVASAHLDDFLEALKKGIQPKLSSKTIKKKYRPTD